MSPMKKKNKKKAAARLEAGRKVPDTRPLSRVPIGKECSIAQMQLFELPKSSSKSRRWLPEEVAKWKKKMMGRAALVPVPPDMDIVYRDSISNTDLVVFATKHRAERNNAVLKALTESRTWGEFRRRMPLNEYEKIIADYFEDSPERSDDEPFDSNCIGAFCDGDYPEWLQQEMLQWFPPELIDKYGRKEDTMLNGDYLSLPLAKAKAIAEDLRALGYRVEHRPDLEFN